MGLTSHQIRFCWVQLSRHITQGHKLQVKSQATEQLLGFSYAPRASHRRLIILQQNLRVFFPPKAVFVPCVTISAPRAWIHCLQFLFSQQNQSACPSVYQQEDSSWRQMQSLSSINSWCVHRQQTSAQHHASTFALYRSRQVAVSYLTSELFKSILTLNIQLLSFLCFLL